MDSLEHLVADLAEYVALGLELLAVFIIAVGSLYECVGIVRNAAWRSATRADRALWLAYARWLVAGLTFQLAADIVRTTIAPTWNDIGKTAAIAVIRTFLTFFLDRDVDKARERSRTEAT